MNRWLIPSLAVALFYGCAHTPPKELIDARQAYQRASEGPAAQLEPAELHTAQEALDQAEKAFNDEPRSGKTTSLAYVAQRKAEKAEAMGAAASERQRATQAGKQFQETQSQKLSAEQQARIDAVEQARLQEKTAIEQQLTAEQKARSDAEKRTEEAQAAQKAGQEQSRLQEKTAMEQQLTTEQKARSDAEKRAEEALSQLAAAKQEPRGLVITLPGSVFFASNQATVLPGAQTQLAEVADTLLKTTGHHLVVEGHTDSRGSATYNQELAQRRAESVRSYLVSKGYPQELIVAKGIGKDRPVADNATAEGRASNRRVEIIVESAGDIPQG